jgi:hypothetical protein
MRLVVDANILIYVNGFGIWPAIFSFLTECRLTLIIIESVYRREVGDSLRQTLDHMIDEEVLALIGDPDKVVQKPKSVRKLQKKILRKARHCRGTSPIDQQLLLVALRDGHPLITDERPLRELAEKCNASNVYDLLDVIDALLAGQAIDDSSRNTLLSGNPGGRQTPPEELDAALAERGDIDRFGCTDAD